MSTLKTTNIQNPSADNAQITLTSDSVVFDGPSSIEFNAGNFSFTADSFSFPTETSIGDVSSTEIAYLDGVTSNIQAQINTKSPTNSPTFTGVVTLPTGTTSVAPLKMNAGVRKTTFTNGDIDYDGKSPYFAHTTSGRAFVNASHFRALTATRSLANATGAQSIFGAALNVAAATAYEIEMIAGISTTGATSNRLGLSFGGTATLTSIGYLAQTTNQATSHVTISNAQQIYVQTAANVNVTAAVAAATFRNISVRGVIRVNAAGTLIPQCTYSAAPGAAPIVAINSYVKLTPIGTNTETSLGSWV